MEVGGGVASDRKNKCVCVEEKALKRVDVPVGVAEASSNDCSVFVWLEISMQFHTNLDWSKCSQVLLGRMAF